MTRGKREPAEIRFWARVDKSGDCWNWTGSLTSSGYGAFDGYTAHRFAWLVAYGYMPVGWFVCHHCDNRRCVRPDHLFVGTHDDNMADLRAKGYTKEPTCRRGHAWTPENTYPLDGGRRRGCRTCIRMRTADYNRRMREKRAA